MSKADTTTVFEAQFREPFVPKDFLERMAFQRLLPQLLVTHGGHYVAIHQEQVIDSDRDGIALVKRVRARFGGIPIHVDLVVPSARVCRIPGPRHRRPSEMSQFAGMFQTTDSIVRKIAHGGE